VPDRLSAFVRFSSCSVPPVTSVRRALDNVEHLASARASDAGAATLPTRFSSCGVGRELDDRSAKFGWSASVRSWPYAIMAVTSADEANSLAKGAGFCAEAVCERRQKRQREDRAEQRTR